MNKKQLFRVLNFADRAEVIALGNRLEEKHEVKTLKKPQKTLVMLKMRESAKNTLFYAGEALASECMVSIEGTRGFAAALGDDLERVYSMAVIDATINSSVSANEELSAFFEKWELRLNAETALDSKVAMSTKVDFNVMEE